MIKWGEFDTDTGHMESPAKTGTPFLNVGSETERAQKYRIIKKKEYNYLAFLALKLT